MFSNENNQPTFLREVRSEIYVIYKRFFREYTKHKALVCFCGKGGVVFLNKRGDPWTHVQDWEALSRTSQTEGGVIGKGSLCTWRMYCFHLQSKTSGAAMTRIKFQAAVFKRPTAPPWGVSNVPCFETMLQSPNNHKFNLYFTFFFAAFRSFLAPLFLPEKKKDFS